ncbi:MAG: transcriptional repressor LexA [Patescibacteria group bacterium]|jgi:repressor LexA
MAPILHKQKRAILDFLKKYMQEHGYAPTLTEIAKAFDLSSLATVHEHLTFLEKSGFIKRDKNNTRGIEIIEPDLKPDLEFASSLLPLVGTIAAGSPIEAFEDKQDMIPVPQNLVGKKNAYILKVRGDSMIESLVNDGDLVVVEKTQLAKDGDMVVALLDDGNATLKKFFRKKNFIRLQPANPNYQPIDVKNVTIQGKVIGLIRKY